MNLKKLFLFLFLPTITILILFIKFPKITELIYSSTIYIFISKILSLLFGYIPFSVAEIILILLIFISIYFLIHIIIIAIKYKKNSIPKLKIYIINLIKIFLLLYSSFLILWGYNYHRNTFSEIQHIKIEPSSLNDLENLCLFLLITSKNLRQDINENPDGTMKLNGTITNMLKRTPLGYKNIPHSYKKLSTNFGYPKNLLSSKIFSYTGISGFFFPFTGEANVNSNTPLCYLPHTAAHELAHQIGYARENEANFIGYLVCKYHPDKDFQYSGYLTSLISSMNALYKNDHKKYTTIRKQYPDIINKDIESISKYYQKYEGKIESISSSINNTYLRTNNQSSGIKSYGEVVDLLLAEYKNNTDK